MPLPNRSQPLPLSPQNPNTADHKHPGLRWSRDVPCFQSMLHMPLYIPAIAGKCLSIQRDLRIPIYPSLSRTCNITSTDDLPCLPRDHVVQIHSHVVISSKPLSRSTTCLPTTYPKFRDKFYLLSILRLGQDFRPSNSRENALPTEVNL